MRKCLGCKKDISKRHLNAKRCEACAKHLAKQPAANLTHSQIQTIKGLIGKSSRDDIAKAAKTSVASVKRWCRDNGGIKLYFFNRYRANPKLVREVCEYYSKHGKEKTQKKYPHVNLRSVVETYAKKVGVPPRQIRWTDEQLIELARFGGIASFTEIANFFDRPNAFKGSIRSAWMKRFGHGCLYLNGAPFHWGRHFVTGDCPSYQTRFGERKKGSVKLFLWIDMEKCLKDEIPEHLRSAISSLAKFQRWLHGRSYRKNIMQIFRGIE